MTQITFLGTCGGRFATIYQTRSTGGIFIADRLKIMLDPGPGAILRLNQEGIDPTAMDVLAISHCHPDHYTDADVLLDGITRGCTQKRGTVIGSESVISGCEGFNQKVSDYHIAHLDNVIVARPNESFQVDGTDISATPTIHTDPTGVGFRFKFSSGVVTYSSDTSISQKIVDSYSDSRVLILALTTPVGTKLPHHMAPEDAVTILKSVEPELAVLTHFGLRAINSGTEEIAQWISEKTGVKTIAAEDGMRIEVEEKIDIKTP